jgi:hypothetical protein
LVKINLANYFSFTSYNQAKMQQWNRFKIMSHLDFSKSTPLCKPRPSKCAKHYLNHIHQKVWKNLKVKFLRPFDRVLGMHQSANPRHAFIQQIFASTINPRSALSSWLTPWTLPGLVPPCTVMVLTKQSHAVA